MSTTYLSKIENNRKGTQEIGTLKRVRVAFARVGRPLTNQDLLRLFLAALDSADVGDKLADVRFVT